MSVTLQQSNVSLDKPEFNPMLVNMQANILKFHGRKFAHHLFLTLDESKIKEAKQWLISFASSKITNSYTQLYDAMQRKSDHSYDGGTVCTLSLANSAYTKLQLVSSITQDETFNHGLRGSADALKDNLNNWESEFRNNHIDILIIVADDNPATAHHLATSIQHQVKAFGTCVKNQRGNVLKKNKTHVGIEHFGYADGISQPMYLEDEITNQASTSKWDDTTNLDMVLVEETDGTDNCFGSYFVFRKLEQNVKGFKNAEGDNGLVAGIVAKINGHLDEIKEDSGYKSKELGGAMIVGRFENSTPVTLSSTALNPNPKSDKLNNNFDYSDDLAGLKCPFHSHVRIVNPRNGNTTQDHAEIKSHRITRRAIPYDDHSIKRIPDEKITDITDDILDDNQPTGKVGLLFQCYQSNINTHFEELQGQWANTGIIDPAPGNPAPASIGEDSLITQGNDIPRSIPQQWDLPAQTDNFQFSGFVTMRGGEYFYTPSIPFLKNL